MGGIARDLQAKMFREVAPVGRLNLHLVYDQDDECKATKWLSSSDQLAQQLNKIDCASGPRQIGRILRHVLRENAKAVVQALTFIGDALEEEIVSFGSLAGQLGKPGVPGQAGAPARVRRDKK
jgi:hypothetical protein